MTNANGIEQLFKAHYAAMHRLTVANSLTDVC